PEVTWLPRFLVILLGDAAVGKSSLLHCFADRLGGGLGEGPDGAATPDPTVGIEFYSWTILMPPTGKVRLQLWDTAGQEQLGSITRSFYRSATGVLLVFNLTNRVSLKHITEWHREAVGDWLPAFVLVGHKSEEARHLATTLGMTFVETSACSNFNVEFSFQTLSGGIQQALGQGILAPYQGCDGIRFSPNQSHCQPLAGRVPWEGCQC
uniref:RAB42, member RAS oncogene family n=1 Tax=Catharus ustulatus TaxID=91951 RepID=A0A8C3VBG9_CATUS